jgi:hypothetical protein
MTRNGKMKSRATQARRAIPEGHDGRQFFDLCLDAFSAPGGNTRSKRSKEQKKIQAVLSHLR